MLQSSPEKETFREHFLNPGDTSNSNQLKRVFLSLNQTSHLARKVILHCLYYK